MWNARKREKKSLVSKVERHPRRHLVRLPARAVSVWFYTSGRRLWQSKLVGKNWVMQSNTGEAEGGLKGRDLSGLDCVLIEVTCIKWNLIGTDTGSLTDRHDADGLRGRRRKGGARETGKGRERHSAVEKRGKQRQINVSFCSFTWPNTKSFMIPNIKREPLKPSNHISEDTSHVRVVIGGWWNV